MVLDYTNSEEISSAELRKLVVNLQNLTRAGYSAYYPNVSTICSLLDKVLVVSKQEKEWNIYFEALYEMLFIQSQSYGDKSKVLRYAEIYYRDRSKYIDGQIQAQSNKDLAELSVISCIEIFQTYKEYYQISDKKMEQFMEFFRVTVEKYGYAGQYYRCLLRLALLYNDKEMAQKAIEGYEKYGVDSCYVCSRRPYLGYHLMMDNPANAEKMIKEIITKQIPKKYQWCYKKCEDANEFDQYGYLLSYCFLVGKPEVFHQYLPIYWKMAIDKSEDSYTQKFLYQAICGDFEYLDKAMEQVVYDIEEVKKQTSFGEICDWLCWYCYFTLLDRRGISAITLDIKEDGFPEKNEDGKYSSLELAAYFKARADEVGTKFAKSRKKFDYRKLKRTYEECAGL